MFCAEKKALLDAYREITASYASAVAELNEKMGTMLKAQYDALYRMTEALRLDAADAQAEFQRHTTAHGCE